MFDCLLVQFAKAPVAGRVKTRMISALSPKQSVELHCQLTEHCLDALLQTEGIDVQLWVGDQPEHGFFQALKKSRPQITVSEQQGHDLGERMYAMFAQMLERYDRVVLVGSDCPFIDSKYLHSAFSALESAPVVIGPATDGGYVLIGLSRLDRQLFAGIDWGSSRVLNQTRRVLEGLKWPSIELPALPDIDRPEDLKRLAEVPGQQDKFKQWLSFC